MDEYTRIKNKHKKNKKQIVPLTKKVEIEGQKPKKNLLFLYATKFLITVILTLVALIVLKQFPKCKEIFHKYIYEQSFSFVAVNEFYKDKFGSSLPFKDFFKKEDKSVFNEKLTYSSVSKYLEGASLTVTDRYLVPVKTAGMIVFIGQKEGYGNTVIIEGTDGIEIWYGNVEKTSLKVYDYVEAGTYLGEVKEKKLYMVFKKDGKTLDYTKYVS